MSLLTLLRAFILIPVVSAGVIKQELPAVFTNELVVRVDQPNDPWINDSCFNPLTVPQNQEYTKCPKKNALQENHWCPVETKGNCESYCEKSLKWSYGKEQPFDSSRCGKGSACRLTQDMRAEVAQTTTTNIGISYQSFSAGASFSWSESKSTGTGIVRDKPADRVNDCGYWTFIPYMVTSCGVTSKARVDSNVLNNKWCAMREDKEVCVTSVYQTKAGVAGGAAVFVATDCDNDGKRLPFCKQDPIYLQLGVSADPQVFQDFRDAWLNDDLSQGVSATAKYQCSIGNWPYKD